MTKKKNDFLKVLVVILIGVTLMLTTILFGTIYLKNQKTIVSDFEITNNQDSPTVINLADSIIIGSPDAKVKIIWFVDYDSPYVRKFYNTAFKNIKSQFIDTKRVVFYLKNYPQSNIHKLSYNMSRMAICIDKQGFGEEIVDTFLTSTVNLNDIEPQFELNSTLYKKCINSNKTDEIINNDIRESYKLNIKMVPAFIIDNKKVEGLEPYFIWKKMLIEELVSVEYKTKALSYS